MRSTPKTLQMKGIDTPGGIASLNAPRGEVSHLTFPALARERNQLAASFPLAPFGNQFTGEIYSAEVVFHQSPDCWTCST
jgi:hypothetical protein